MLCEPLSLVRHSLWHTNLQLRLSVVGRPLSLFTTAHTPQQGSEIGSKKMDGTWISPTLPTASLQWASLPLAWKQPTATALTMCRRS